MTCRFSQRMSQAGLESYDVRATTLVHFQGETTYHCADLRRVEELWMVRWGGVPMPVPGMMR